MNQVEKSGIKQSLSAVVAKKKSAKAVANEWTDVSTATISQVLNDNWELISDEMWRTIGNLSGYYKAEWVVAETSVYRKLKSCFAEAKENPSGIYAVVINSSLGKSTAVESFCETTGNTYYVRCHRLMSIRVLLRQMLKSMGKDSSGTTIEMLDNMVGYLAKERKPLFIIDEVDKLKDDVLEMFVDIENKLNNKCGFVFLATPHLRKHVEACVSRGKRGFAELYSRMKKKFWDFTPSKAIFRKDVAVICLANGVADESVINEFTNKCEEDFRVLADLITAFKKSLNN